MVYAGFEAERVRELKYEKLQGKDCLSRDWSTGFDLTGRDSWF